MASAYQDSIDSLVAAGAMRRPDETTPDRWTGSADHTPGADVRITVYADGGIKIITETTDPHLAGRIIKDTRRAAQIAAAIAESCRFDQENKL